MEVVVPGQYASRVAGRNRVRQLIRPARTAELIRKGRVLAIESADGVVPLVAWTKRTEGGGPQLTFTAKRLQELAAAKGTPDLGDGSWFGLRDLATPESWRTAMRGTFNYVCAPDLDSPGLRSPQMGALFAILGYWTTAPSDPATVALPTGTGKTETMLALLCAAELDRVMVLVPSDALRDQVAAKFETLGILPSAGVIPADSPKPVVGRVEHAFTSEAEAQEFAQACNVIVTTPDALIAAGKEISAKLLSACTHLFIDEAHHIAARTWRVIRDQFSNDRIVQFTATPFREDGQRLGGKLIYSFPLREAQRLKYFSNINYVSIVKFGDPDRAIATAALKQLRDDVGAGLDHLLMARVQRISRATEVQSIYRELAPEFLPVVLHSHGSVTDRKEALRRLRARESRIIVCVDMLGEGFDLPNLKIAAMHDPHKSVGITLQFIGRFARTAGASIGDATAVVSRPEGQLDVKLRRLFAEDADWNQVVRDLSEGEVGYHGALSEFESRFSESPDAISIRSLLPKMSAVVYREAKAWDPTC